MGYHSCTSGFWISVAATLISCRDIEVWPFSVGMLVKWVSFLSSLHWPAVECDFGVGGESASAPFLDQLLSLFHYPAGRLLPYLMVLFLCGIVLSSLLLRLLFGFCVFLDMFLSCLLFMIRLLLVVFRLSVVVLDLGKRDFD